MNLINHWIDGKPHGGSPERTGPVFDPATGKQTAEVAFATTGEVDAAVASAADRRRSLNWRRDACGGPHGGSSSAGVS